MSFYWQIYKCWFVLSLTDISHHVITEQTDCRCIDTRMSAVKCVINIHLFVVPPLYIIHLRLSHLSSLKCRRIHRYVYLYHSLLKIISTEMLQLCFYYTYFSCESKAFIVYLMFAFIFKKSLPSEVWTSEGIAITFPQAVR